MNSDSTSRAFHFKATTPEGTMFDGQLAAGDLDQALSKLRSGGFTPLRVEDRPLRTSWLVTEIGPAYGKQISLAECEMLCREFALLSDARISIVDALGLVEINLAPHTRLGRFVASTRNSVRLGQSLSQALTSTGFLLPTDLVPVVKAGEDTGALSGAFAMLATSYADQLRSRRAYLSVLTYPALLLLVSFAVFALIAGFVAPTLASLFQSMDRPVPVAISLLARGASLVGTNWPLLVGIGTGIVVLVGAGGMVSEARRLARRGVFSLPVVGSALWWSAGQRFAGTLRLYLASNVPLASALPNALQSAAFPISTRTADAVVSFVREGGKLSVALSRIHGLPRKINQFVAVGEGSGHIADVLAALVVDARNRFEQRMALVNALLAPLLILVVGAAIGAVIFSVFSALLDINGIVQ